MDVEYDGNFYKDTMISDMNFGKLSGRKKTGADLGRFEYRVEREKGFGTGGKWNGCHVFEYMNMDIAHPFKNNMGDIHIVHKPASAERTAKPLLVILLLALTNCSGYVR